MLLALFYSRWRLILVCSLVARPILPTVNQLGEYQVIRSTPALARQCGPASENGGIGKSEIRKCTDAPKTAEN